MWWVLWTHPTGDVGRVLGMETSSTPGISLTCCVSSESHLTSLHIFLFLKRIFLFVQISPPIVVKLRKEWVEGYLLRYI